MANILDQEQSFLAQMDKKPEAMDLRLIFSDWLEEQDDPRAGVIRDLVDFHQEKRDEIDLSNPELLWASLRAFAPPRKRLKKLRPFQERMLEVWQDLWMGIALDTRPTNRAKAERLFREGYQCTQGSGPEQIVWHFSPPGVYQDALNNSETPEARYVKWFADWWPEEKTSADRTLQDLASSKITGKIGEIIGGVVSGPIHDDALSQTTSDYEYLRVEYGAWSAYGLSVHSFFHHVCGLPVHPALRCLFDLALEVCNWFPFRDRVIVSEKPSKIKLRGRRLKVIQYRDGYTYRPSVGRER